MFAKGFIHRDISIANVMLEPWGDLFRGLLIDYDYAIRLDRVRRAAAGRRTVSKRASLLRGVLCSLLPIAGNASVHGDRNP